MAANSQLVRVCEDIQACSSLDDASKILACIRENKLEEIAQSGSQSYTLHTGFEERIWDLMRKHYDMKDDGPCRKVIRRALLSYDDLQHFRVT
jgi:chromosome condensin MukBEF complex kleisin-like MukF subunit